MKAEEIRKQFKSNFPQGESAIVTVTITDLLVEIAAQLAELNENLIDRSSEIETALLFIAGKIIPGWADVDEQVRAVVNHELSKGTSVLKFIEWLENHCWLPEEQGHWLLQEYEREIREKIEEKKRNAFSE